MPISTIPKLFQGRPNFRLCTPSKPNFAPNFGFPYFSHSTPTLCVIVKDNHSKGNERKQSRLFFFPQAQLKKQYWFDCACVACEEDWPLMHEMTDDTLNFRCQDCLAKVVFNTSSTNPMLRCICGTPVPMLQVKDKLLHKDSHPLTRSFYFHKALKKIGETDLISERAKHAMKEGKLGAAQDLYCDYLTTLDKFLVPPYQDYYKIQQSIWKCIWMRHGNRVIRAKVRKPAVPEASDDYDTVD